MGNIVEPSFLSGVGVGITVSFLTWLGNRIWKKHGPRIADRLPIIAALGLSESPVEKWFEESIEIAEETELLWKQKLDQRHVHSKDIVESRKETAEKISQIRGLKTSAAENVPQEAIDCLDEFVEDWGERQGYFVESMPEETFENEGQKVQSAANRMKTQLKEIREA